MCAHIFNAATHNNHLKIVCCLKNSTKTHLIGIKTKLASVFSATKGRFTFRFAENVCLNAERHWFPNISSWNQNTYRSVLACIFSVLNLSIFFSCKTSLCKNTFHSDPSQNQLEKNISYAMENNIRFFFLTYECTATCATGKLPIKKCLENSIKSLWHFITSTGVRLETSFSLNLKENPHSSDVH